MTDPIAAAREKLTKMLRRWPDIAWSDVPDRVEEILAAFPVLAAPSQDAMTDEELLALARSVVGEAFFGRADYVPDHKDIFIQQTYDGCVNMLTSHLRPMIERHRAEVERLRADWDRHRKQISGLTVETYELRGEIGRVAQDRDTAYEKLARKGAEVERLTRERDEAKIAFEGLASALRDKHPNGKTIVDFLNVWHDQQKARAKAAESALAAARAEVEAERKLAEDWQRLHGIVTRRAEAAESALAASQKRIAELEEGWARLPR